MAKLKSADGQSSVGIAPVAYQFAESSDDKWDSNRLRIHAEFRSPHCSFEATQPALTTWETRELISKITEWIHGSDREERIDFTEPYISARLLKIDERGLRVAFVFADGFAPPDSGGRTPEVHIRNTPEVFAAFCTDLEMELSVFPERDPAGV